MAFMPSGRPGRSLRRPSASLIFNTDQGSQFTSFAFTGRLLAAGIRISMDGRLMRLLGLQAVYRAPRTSDRHTEATRLWI